MRFTADVTHVPRARRWVVHQAAASGAPEDVLRVVALLASEVVTNAVQHGPTGGEVEVSVAPRGDRLRVAVRDESPRTPVRLDPAPTGPSGRGVQLVDRLAADWGVDAASGGKVVWFEVRRGAPGAKP